VNFGEFVNGIPSYKAIPENFIYLSAFTMDLGAKEIRNYATSQSCSVSEKLTDQ
jgi:PP-loop superfamily ATP-utilizing enzyme